MLEIKDLSFVAKFFTRRGVTLNKLILFLMLVVPGSAVVTASAWWCVNDFTALVNTNQHFQELTTQGASKRELFVIANRENTHRLNVGFNATWILLGGILAGMGIQEMTEVDK